MTDSRKGPKAIWSIGGGKGGTGKTLIASNMAVYLAKLGQRVLLVDADLGGANLHTCLGLEEPCYGLGEFFVSGQQDLDGLIEESGVANLSLVTGALDYSAFRPRFKDRSRLHQALKRADVDYVVLDVGSGTSQGVMDLFLMGETGICVVLPEPTSIENTYRFLKETLYWKLLRGSRKRSIKETVQRAFHNPKTDEFMTIPRLLDQVGQDEPGAQQNLQARMNDISVRLVINQVRRHEDAEVGFAVRSAIHKYFGIRVDFVGYINFDDLVLQSVRMRKPLLQNFPESKAAKCIENIAHKLLAEGQLAFDF